MNFVSQTRSLTTKVKPAPAPSSGCISSFSELVAWVSSFTVDVAFNKLFGYTAGKQQDATREDQSMPRYMFTDDDRYIGVQVWVPSLGGWVVGGVIGELKTVARTQTTVEEDMRVKGLKGWAVCDGSTNGVPDLTVELEGSEQNLIDPANAVADTVKSKAKVHTPWFKGSSAAWEIYTVMYLGAP